jgi:hypothetical protein
MESMIIDPNEGLTRTAGGIILPGSDNQLIKTAGIVEPTPPLVPPEFKGESFCLIGEASPGH